MCPAAGCLSQEGRSHDHEKSELDVARLRAEGVLNWPDFSAKYIKPEARGQRQ